MPSIARILALPSSVLLLLATSLPSTATEAQWPHESPATEYLPDEKTFVTKSYKIQEQLGWKPPVGVRKMSDDEGEKFFWDYWQFDDHPREDIRVREDLCSVQRMTDTPRLRRRQLSEDTAGVTNATMLEDLFPPFLLHEETPMQSSKWSRFLPRALLQGRAFQCPSGTSNCSSISRPNSCCATDETCVLVKDTGLGDVGCCPYGGNCGNQVTNCDSSQGYTSCPSDKDNGGCCIPHFMCDGIGCELCNLHYIPHLALTKL